MVVRRHGHSEGAGRAAALYDSFIESSKANSVTPLRRLTDVLSNRATQPCNWRLPDEFATLRTAPAGRCAP